VWIVDLAMTAKVRPAVVLSVPPDDADRALAPALRDPSGNLVRVGHDLARERSNSAATSGRDTRGIRRRVRASRSGWTG
jgi:hypothetical protein